MIENEATKRYKEFVEQGKVSRSCMYIVVEHPETGDLTILRDDIDGVCNLSSDGPTAYFCANAALSKFLANDLPIEVEEKQDFLDLVFHTSANTTKSKAPVLSLVSKETNDE